MSVLDKLKKKIIELKQNYQALEAENKRLKEELEKDENKNNCKEIIEQLELEVKRLKQEIEEKEVEMEAILDNLEELLD